MSKMNVAYREVNQNGELLLEDEFNDDLEISEAGRISCKELQIGKTTIVTTGRVLQNVTLSDLITLTVGDMLISGHTINTYNAGQPLILKGLGITLDNFTQMSPFSDLDLNSNELLNVEKISFATSNGIQITVNTISTKSGSAAAIKLIPDGGAGVQLGSIFSTPIKFFSEWSGMPTNDSPGSNLNVMSLTFRTAYGQQTHTMVRVIGNAVFRATALGLTRFQVSLTGCPAINNIDLFTGFANHISGQTAGSCDVFALEVEGLGSVGVAPVVAFSGKMTCTDQEGALRYCIDYRTIDNI